jgi:ribosomal-protein-alanine N-acetyltransferase
MNCVPLDLKIESSRLYLRRRVASDNEMIYSATRYEGFNDGMLWDPPNDISELEDKESQVEERWKAGISYQFAIMNKTLNQSMGIISIRKKTEKSDWSIGFYLHPNFQKQGFMTDACKKIIEFGFNRLDATSIEAQHATWNTPSRKVLESSGMKFVETLPHGFRKNGKWVEEKRYVIGKDEWQKNLVLSAE